MHEIAPVRPPQMFDALQLLYSSLPPDERQEQCRQALLSFSRQQLSTDDFLVATRDERIVGVLFALRQPGKCAFIWPPIVGAGEPDDGCTEALFRDLGRRFDDNGILFAQCLLPLEDRTSRAILDRHGFMFRGDLLFLTRDLAKPLAVRPVAGLTFVTPADAALARFARLVERSYIGSLDCPCLEGVRSGEAALEAHRSAGQHDESLWRLYQWEGADAGITLLARHEDPVNWEVVYTGVAPEYRGHGIGKAMLEAALEQARVGGASKCTWQSTPEILSRVGFIPTWVLGARNCGPYICGYSAEALARRVAQADTALRTNASRRSAPTHHGAPHQRITALRTNASRRSAPTHHGASRELQQVMHSCPNGGCGRRLLADR